MSECDELEGCDETDHRSRLRTALAYLRAGITVIVGVFIVLPALSFVMKIAEWHRQRGDD